jgi:hypothetical protein
LAAACGSEGGGSRPPADRTASKSTKPTKGDGVRVLHSFKFSRFEACSGSSI